MQIKKINFENCPNCYELSIDNKKMIITSEFGPRILFYNIDSKENILFYDKEKKLKYKKWYLHGGHRVTIAPEDSHTYNPENKKCRVEIENDKIKVSQVDRIVKIEKSLTIYEKNKRFFIENSIKNISPSFLTSKAVWAITCIKPEGTAFLPWSTKGKWKINKIIYWQEWGAQKTNFHSEQYKMTEDLFLITPDGEKGKVGVAGYEGFVGISTNNFTFIKKFNRIPFDIYPDDNCAIECYTCPNYIELETLSPQITLSPYDSLTHTEEWILTDKKIDPVIGKKIRNLL